MTPPVRPLPVEEARRLITDLYAPKPGVYWVDLLGSAALGWTGFVVAVAAPAGSLAHVAALLVAAVFLYRAVAFVHEIAHIRRGRLPGFRWAYNLVVGFPLMVPSFLYRGVHNDHHKQGMYGTEADGEYIPFALEGRLRILGYIAFACLGPVMLFGRLVLLVPIGWVSPRFSRFLWTKASSLQIDMAYVRPPPSARDEGDWRLQELMTCLYGGVALGLSIAGVLPWRVLFTWYGLLAGMLLVNTLRTLAAHRYRNPADHPLDVPGQFADSVNIPGRWITPLWAPVGLQFHATHHLFPALPYHALREAHARLSTQLSDPSAYLATERSGMWAAIAELWRDAARPAWPAAGSSASPASGATTGASARETIRR